MSRHGRAVAPPLPQRGPRHLVAAICAAHSHCRVQRGVLVQRRWRQPLARLQQGPGIPLRAARRQLDGDAAVGHALVGAARPAGRRHGRAARRRRAARLEHLEQRAVRRHGERAQDRRGRCRLRPERRRSKPAPANAAAAFVCRRALRRRRRRRLAHLLGLLSGGAPPHRRRAPRGGGRERDAHGVRRLRGARAQPFGRPGDRIHVHPLQRRRGAAQRQRLLLVPIGRLCRRRHARARPPPAAASCSAAAAPSR